MHRSTITHQFSAAGSDPGGNEQNRAAADVITLSAHGGSSVRLLQCKIPVQISKSVIIIAKPGSKQQQLPSNEDNLL